MLIRNAIVWTLALACPSVTALADQGAWIEFPGKKAPGQGKRIVLISGDEEYRSEEALPQLAKILATHHGFHTVVLFAVDPETGVIDPNVNNNIPGLEALKTADLMVIFTRFRNLPDDQMAHVAAYVDAGKPIVGMRTSTHAFNNPKSKHFANYNWTAKDWKGGFGGYVLGETWYTHHGHHGSQSTRGIVAGGAAGHPVLRGIRDGDVWGPTDVYGVHLPLPGDSKPLILGQVLTGMKPADPPVEGKQNDPMMPVAWTKSYKGASGASSRVFATTMGASQDLESEGVRRLLVNGCYWAIGMENQIPAKSKVDFVGTFKPSPFKFNGARKGLTPADYAKP